MTSLLLWVASLFNFESHSRNHPEVDCPHLKVDRNFELATTASDNFYRDVSNDNWLLKTSIHCNETQVDLQEGRTMSHFAHAVYKNHPRKWNNFFL